MAWRILSGVMRLSAAQKFSQLLHFSKRQRKEEDVTASLSLWWNSIGASEPLSAGGIFAVGITVGKTVGFKDRGLGRGHFVTHSSLCLFVTSPLFPTLLVVSDSLPLLQGATNTTVPDIYKHRLGHPLTTLLLFLVPFMLLFISHGRPQLLSFY